MSTDPRKKQHVAIQRIKYTGGEKPRYIEPNQDNPQLGETFTLEHLSPVMYEALLGVAYEEYNAKAATKAQE